MRPLRKLSQEQIDALVEEATVDTYNESEQAVGFYEMISGNLEVPFRTKILGVEVMVDGVGLASGDRIVAKCRRGARRQRVDLLDLPLPVPWPKGAEWIEAYRHWSRGARGRE
jgi:hypothetical protein